MSFNVEIIKRQEGIFVAKFEGRLDTETYTLCEEKIKPLLAQSTKTLILDLEKLEYISSSGLGVIFNAKKKLEDQKASLILTNLKPQINKVFEIVKALPKESVFSSMEEVDAYLDAVQKKAIENQNPS